MWLPFASRRPVARIDRGQRDTRWRAAVLHTCGSNASSLYNWWQSGAAGPNGAHLFIDRYGLVEQYVDTDHECAHAWDANGWTVGIETWDNGDPENTPWTQAQLDSIDRILRALGVPGRLLEVGPSHGVGFHQEFDAWNQNAHNCPGTPRRGQVPGIIERLAGGGAAPAPEGDDAGWLVLT